MEPAGPLHPPRLLAPVTGPCCVNETEQRRLSLLGHDLRAALGDVIAGLDMIDDRALDPESRLQLERVRAAGESVGRLVSEVLVKMSGEHDVAFEIGDCACYALLDLVRDLERRWTGHAVAGGLSVETDLSHDLPVLIGTDRTMLERILSNLLANAIKYAERGAVTLAVDMRAGGELRFTVHDEGPGFTANALERLFDFGGRPASARRPGTGMGLHIVKQLADRLGGRLLVSNKQTEADATPRGAQVSLLLPEAAWRHPGSDLGEDRLPDLTGKRVLIAEDNPTNQLVLTRMLGHMGAETHLVEDGQAAFAALRDGGFALALVDIEMPRMSGIEVIVRTRQLPGAAGRVPILAVTAYVLRNHRDEIYRAGADGIVAKPVMSLAAFGMAIASLLQRAEGAEAPPHTAEAPPAQHDPARLQHLLAIAGSDGREELLLRLQSDLGSATEGLLTAIGTRDLHGVRASTHVLISLSGAVGAGDLQGLAEAMNRAAHRGDWTAVGAAEHQIGTRLSALQAEIADVLRHDADRSPSPSALAGP